MMLSKPIVHFAAQMVSRIVVLPLPRELVASWLPDELELHPQDVTAADKHPITLIFDEQQHFHVNLLPWVRWNVLEFAVVLPWVRFKRSGVRRRGPFQFAARLYVDSLTSVMGGRLLYGFQKQMAQLSVADGGREFSVTDRSSQDLLSRVEFTEKPEQISEAEMAQLEPLIQQPSVSRHGWSYIYFASDWHWERALVRPLAASVQTRNGFCGETLTEEATFQVDGTAALGEGAAFSIETDFLLTTPHLRWSRALERYDRT